jgi:hypothetical protein
MIGNSLRGKRGLLIAGLAFDHPDYLERWKTLKPASTLEEVSRNFAIRQLRDLGLIGEPFSLRSLAI